MSKQKAKGTAAETAVVEYLREWFPSTMRMPLQGAGDRGDVALSDFPFPVVIEVKNHARMVLSEWIDEAETEAKNAKTWLGIVWHKRVRKGQPKDWYVSMRGEVFVQLLVAYRDLLDLEERSSQLAHMIGGGGDASRS